MIALIVIPLLIVFLIKTKGFTTKIDTLLIVAPITLGVFSLILFLVIKRIKKQFISYRLIINEDEIIRTQLYLEDIIISLNEVKSIVKNNKGEITIKGKTSNQIIFIPTQVERFENLKQILSKISPIKENEN